MCLGVVSAWFAHRIPTAKKYRSQPSILLDRIYLNSLCPIFDRRVIIPNAQHLKRRELMMSNNLVIFGLGDMAQLAHFYFTKDTCYNVVAFAVDREFRDIDTLYGLPVVDFETVPEAYPPAS